MKSIRDFVAQVSKKDLSELHDDTSLIGDAGVLDSLGLVELCLQLEDFAAELGFEFDWTSDSSMSQSKSMFRSVASLEEEFERQRNS